MVPEIEVVLVRAPNDPPSYKTEYQAELRGLYEKLRAAGVSASPRGPKMAFDSADGGTSLVSEFLIPLAQAVGPTLGVVLVAWLKAKSGRKVRLKFDGVEAEARTPADIKELLKRAAEFREGTRNARKGN